MVSESKSFDVVSMMPKYLIVHDLEMISHFQLLDFIITASVMQSRITSLSFASGAEAAVLWKH